MIDLAVIPELLSMSGDAALLIVVILFWRLDRRLIKIETRIENIINEQSDVRGRLKECAPSSVADRK